jgi:hypothetical protein
VVEIQKALKRGGLPRRQFWILVALVHAVEQAQDEE